LGNQACVSQSRCGNNCCDISAGP